MIKIIDDRHCRFLLLKTIPITLLNQTKSLLKGRNAQKVKWI